jgi:hypothetical protein
MKVKWTVPESHPHRFTLCHEATKIRILENWKCIKCPMLYNLVYFKRIPNNFSLQVGIFFSYLTTLFQLQKLYSIKSNSNTIMNDLVQTWNNVVASFKVLFCHQLSKPEESDKQRKRASDLATYLSKHSRQCCSNNTETIAYLTRATNNTDYKIYFWINCGVMVKK